MGRKKKKNVDIILLIKHFFLNQQKATHSCRLHKQHRILWCPRMGMAEPNWWSFFKCCGFSEGYKKADKSPFYNKTMSILTILTNSKWNQTRAAKVKLIE